LKISHRCFNMVIKFAKSRLNRSKCRAFIDGLNHRKPCELTTHYKPILTIILSFFFSRSVMYNVYMVVLITAIYQELQVTGFAIAPPSWSDANVNPCAKNSTNGWQHVYYPPMKQCFKIFTLGYPCPESMELSPILNGLTGHGECKCPPGKVQLNTTSTCHKIFDRGPCEMGQYLNPISSEKGVKSSYRLGECKKLKQCAKGKVHWPEKDTCYELYTRGPCVNGKLLSFDENAIPKCQVCIISINIKVMKERD
jgi:Domain of unknown function (DUF4789)